MTQLLPMEDAPKGLDEVGWPILIVLYFEKDCPVIAWWNLVGGDYPKRGDWAVNSPNEMRSYSPKNEPIGWTHLPIKWYHGKEMGMPGGSSEPTELT